jgi:heme A synthase
MQPTPSTNRPHAQGVRGSLAARLALGAAGVAAVLVLVGGSVTSLGAGMAVDGWLVPEGHFLWNFPLDKWLRDLGTFVEHSHRLLGSAVGLLAIGALAAAWIEKRPRAQLALSALALAAVCGQGALGGLRVLENSPRLAFVHGLCAQAVFALLALQAYAFAPAAAPERGALARAPGLARIAWIAALVGLVQAALGGWYRHALRQGGETAWVEAGLGLHLIGALVAFGAYARLAARLELASGAQGASESAAARALHRRARRIALLLGAQLALGLFAWLGQDAGAGANASAAAQALLVLSSSAHVLVAALLLAQAALVGACAREPQGARAAHPAHAPRVRRALEASS